MLGMTGFIKRNLELQGKLPDKWKDHIESSDLITINSDGSVTLKAGTYTASGEDYNMSTGEMWTPTFILTEDTKFQGATLRINNNGWNSAAGSVECDYYDLGLQYGKNKIIQRYALDNFSAAISMNKTLIFTPDQGLGFYAEDAGSNTWDLGFCATGIAQSIGKFENQTVTAHLYEIDSSENIVSDFGEKVYEGALASYHSKNSSYGNAGTMSYYSAGGPSWYSLAPIKVGNRIKLDLNFAASTSIKGIYLSSFEMTAQPRADVSVKVGLNQSYMNPEEPMMQEDYNSIWNLGYLKYSHESSIPIGWSFTES